LAASIVLAGQRLNELQGAGAALVLGAIVGHELGPLIGRWQGKNRIEGSHEQHPA
jgi:hypothetical protein